MHVDLVFKIGEERNLLWELYSAWNKNFFASHVFSVFQYQLKCKLWVGLFFSFFFFFFNESDS